MKLPKGFTKHNTAVIADFDRTIGCGNTCFGVFTDSPWVPKILSEKRHKIYLKYRPIETNLDISEKEKRERMKQWHEEANMIFEEHLRFWHMWGVQNYARKNIHPRNGAKQFFDDCSNLGIPRIIYSAGLKNIIDTVIQHNDLNVDHVVANNLAFSKFGKCFATNGESPYFTGNKKWKVLPPEIHSFLEDKTHLVILGDSLGDLTMAPKNKQVLSIGFLHQDQKEHEKIFRNAFDHVIESDTGDNGDLAKLIEQLRED